MFVSSLLAHLFFFDYSKIGRAPRRNPHCLLQTPDSRLIDKGSLRIASTCIPRPSWDTSLPSCSYLQSTKSERLGRGLSFDHLFTVSLSERCYTRPRFTGSYRMWKATGPFPIRNRLCERKKLNENNISNTRVQVTKSYVSTSLLDSKFKYWQQNIV